MKIHKKILTQFLSSTSPFDKEGYLYKKVKGQKKHPKILHLQRNQTIILHSFGIEKENERLPSAVVCPEGEPALLPGASC